MAHSVWQAFITDGGETVVPGATITVLKEADGLPASLYDGPAGSAIANPTTSGVDGLVRFYAPAGLYKITVTKGALTKEFRNVPLGDAAARAVGVANGVAPLDGLGLVPDSMLQYAKDYADGLVIGLLDDRGNYDASVNLFPTAGGSGVAGAVMKGDTWSISVGGTLGSKNVSVGDWIRALSDAPGQVASNWATSSVSGKQDTLVSGTNIKTVAGNSLLGAGNVALAKADVGLSDVDNTSDASKPVSTAQQAALDTKQATLVSGTNIKTVNGTSLLGAGDVAVQATLVSGTNIKTVNGESLLGAGNLIAGLSFFAEARTTSAPNATVPVHSLTPIGADSQIDMQISAKGTGSLLWSVPDNTATGGNKRGAYAIDFQQNRADATQVASGGGALLIASYRCTASGSSAACLAAAYSVASNSYAGVYNSDNCTASGQMASVHSSNSGTASGDRSMVMATHNGCQATGPSSVVIASSDSSVAAAIGAVVIGGATLTSDGVGSIVMGGSRAKARQQHYVIVFGSQDLGYATSQDVKRQVGVSTSDATPLKMSSYGSNDFGSMRDANYSYKLDNNMCSTFTIRVSCKGYETANVNNRVAGGFFLRGVVRRNNGEASIALVGAVTKESWLEAALATADVNAVVDTTYGCLHVEVTGVAGYTLNWHATIDAAEIVG